MSVGEWVFWGSRFLSGFGGFKELLASGFGRWSALTLLFSAAAVVQTWPLVLHISDSITIWPDAPFDSWQFLWGLWWVKHAIVELHTNPFHTDLLFAPQGTDLNVGGLTFVNGVLSIPLQLVTNNLILSWNMLALLSFVLSGLGMYALSYRVNRNHGAALISGYIFAFAPLILMHFPGHWNLSTTWPIPLFVLFLLRLHDTGRFRDAFAAGIFLAILTYNNLEYGAWAGLFLGLFLAYWSFVYLQRRDWGRLSALSRGVALVIGIWFAAGAPLLAPAFVSISSGDYVLAGGDEYYSTDLAAFVTPSPLWGPGVAPIQPGPNHATAGTIENTVYLGIMPLVLAALAFFAIRRTPHRVVFWAAVFLLFATLALGPYLYIGDTKIFSLLGISFEVPLPYQVYDELPVLSAGRVPARMIVFALVGLAVLAGTGFDVLTSWLKPMYKMIVPLAAVVVLSLVVLEYWNPPADLYEPPVPEILKTIGDEPGDFAVLNVPWGRGSGARFAGDGLGARLAGYYQTIHGKAALGGFLPRATETEIDWALEQPGLRFLICADPEVAGCRGVLTAEDMDPDLVQQVFRQFRIKYVVVRGPDNYGNPGRLAQEDYLRAVAGLTLIYDGSDVIVYRNQDVQ